MPIQFRCASCGKLLQTEGNTAGQQAQCPACGNVMAIPGAPAGASPESIGASSGQGGDAGSPPPRLPEDRAVAPVFQVADLRAFAANRVAGPSIALIVLGVLTIVLQVLSILANILQVGIAGAAGKNADMIAMFIGGTVGTVLAAISIVGAMVITIGGMRMRNLENYGLSMTASILSLIPCFGPCCLLRIPIGIWALVTLSDNTVRTAFRS